MLRRLVSLFERHPVAPLLALSALLVFSACRRESNAPKTDLTEKEKQQIRELNEQRASEWGSTKRK